ncbi:hypothetical protein N665_0721s0002 [Sinapis alba]|nr:hypothetical protein N665_0721s0002 [Sinapis alba]
MSSPIRRCSLKGKAITTASDSDNSSSPRPCGPRAITLGGMDNPRPTSEDLAELDDNERSVVQFSLELEEREMTVQVPVDNVAQETEPRSTQVVNPSADAGSVDKDKISAKKEINFALANLLPMRWTGTDFDFDEEIDTEQERRLSVKKNQKWENHFPTRSTFKSVRRLILQTSLPAGFSFLIPANHQRPWTPPVGYTCVYESWFNNCSLWWPLPEFLTTYCSRQKIALTQYTANRIRILVTLTVLAAELGIKMSVCLFVELTTPSITKKTWFFYGKMVPKYNVITGEPSKVNFRNRAYFYVKINEASFEDPSGGSQSFLEEVEAIRTLSHQHWTDISEARIQTALNRINRAESSVEIPSRSRSQRMGKLNRSSLPSYADTAGTPTKELRPSRSPPFGRPEEHLGDDNQNQEPSLEENPSLEPVFEAEAVTTTEILMEEHLMDPSMEEDPQGDQFQEPDPATQGDEVVEYPNLIDFKYQRTNVHIVEDHEAPARLFRQIKLKKKGIPELEQLSQNSRYQEMTRAGAIVSSNHIRVLPTLTILICSRFFVQFFENDNLMVRDYEANLRAQDEKLALKTESLKRKRKEIAELANKCDTYEEQETSEIELRFETTTRRLRESREHEVRKDMLRVESALRQQVAPGYEKMRQFIEEQSSIQFKLALYSQAKGTREGLEKIHTQGLSMDEILQQARADEVQYQEDLQGMEVIDASKINLAPIGLDKHGSNMAAFSPQDIEDLRT